MIRFLALPSMLIAVTFACAGCPDSGPRPDSAYDPEPQQTASSNYTPTTESSGSTTKGPTTSTSSSPTTSGDPTTGSRPWEPCCKICGEKSKPCGDSCIILTANCHKGLGCACDAPTPQT